MPARRQPSRRNNLEADRSRFVFLNIPYDDSYTDLFLAYIAGLCAFGLKPRASLEIVSSQRRLEKIHELIEACKYSVHDLSKVKSDSVTSLPRFNMPFELGLAVASEIKGGNHDWFVFEEERHRLQRTLSDLNGTDPLIHNGKPDGIFRELLNIFERSERRAKQLTAPDITEMGLIHIILHGYLADSKAGSDSQSPFEPSVFRQLIQLAAQVKSLLRTIFQTLAATKAVIDQAQAHYQSGVIPKIPTNYAVLKKANAAQSAAVKAFLTYWKLGREKGSAIDIESAQRQVMTALADLPQVIVYVKALYPSAK